MAPSPAGAPPGDGGSSATPGASACARPPPPPPSFLAPLSPAHRPALEAHHAALFPVDYEPAFFDAVMTNTDGVFSFGLFAGGEEGDQAGASPTSTPPTAALLGFVTARAVPWAELSGDDLHALGLALPPGCVSRDGARGAAAAAAPGADVAVGPSPVAAVYILTLGVPSPSHRRGGAGRALMAAACARAGELGAGAVYLHVAAFNAEATAFYASLGGGGGKADEGVGGGSTRPPPSSSSPPFRLVATLPAFYSIHACPPVPGVTRYDAHLLVRRVDRVVAGGGTAGRHAFHLPAWRARSALASPPLAPPLPPTPGRVVGGGEGAPLPTAFPALWRPLAALAAWARSAWAGLPPAPAWVAGLCGGGGGRRAGVGEKPGRQRQQQQQRGVGAQRPVVEGDII